MNGRVHILAEDDTSGISGGIVTSTNGPPTPCLPASSSITNNSPRTKLNSTNVVPPSGTSIMYCVSDDAGNITQGQYPAVVVNYNGCFADGSMNAIPNLDTYKNNTPSSFLIPRMRVGKFGYSLSDSDRTAQNQAFQTRLAQNITTSITSQHSPTPFSL